MHINCAWNISTRAVFATAIRLIASTCAKNARFRVALYRRLAASTTSAADRRRRSLSRCPTPVYDRERFTKRRNSHRVRAAALTTTCDLQSYTIKSPKIKQSNKIGKFICEREWDLKLILVVCCTQCSTAAADRFFGDVNRWIYWSFSTRRARARISPGAFTKQQRSLAIFTLTAVILT